MNEPVLDVACTLVYNKYCCDPRLIDDNLQGYTEATPIIKAIVREFVNQRKIIGSFRTACSVIRSNLLKDGVVVTDDDIICAYAIGAGGGLEYEWPFE